MKSLICHILRCFARDWRSLFLVDIAYKVMAFILLTPLVGLMFRIMMAVSGNAALSDLDILYFFLGPLGWFIMVVIGALGLGMVALEQASLLGVICARDAQNDIRLADALQFAVSRLVPVLKMTSRLAGRILLHALPFVVALGVVYALLLTDHDINYYLKEKPPAFWNALGLCSVIILALFFVMIRLVAGCLFALPIVLFENIHPAGALRASRERADGHRMKLTLWITGWSLTMLAASTLVSGVVVGLGRWIVPLTVGSLEWMVISVGCCLVLWGLATLAVNLLGSTLFAVMLIVLYRKFGGDGHFNKTQLAAMAAGDRDPGFRITRTRLLVAGMAGIFIAALAGMVSLKSVDQDQQIEIIAHRGSSKAAPENTLAAVQQAIEDGADWVEIDVQETADGEVVVFHDSDFMKLAGNNLKIWDATLADLKNIDVGSWFDERFQNERVPTLREVLALCRGKINVNIELKYYGHDLQLEQKVADVVDEQNMTTNVMVMSLKMAGVSKMKSIRPAWETGLLMTVAAGNLDKIDADFIAVNASFADRKFIQTAHKADRYVFVWTVNDPVTMCVMIGRGVDGLITDYPALARSVLLRLDEMTAPERWMIQLAGLFGVTPQIAEQ